MANGFCLNGTACRQIDAKRRTVRHSGNSSDLSRQISAIVPRLFRNTEQCLREAPSLDAVRWQSNELF
jgi:hypothetical protein